MKIKFEMFIKHLAYSAWYVVKAQMILVFFPFGLVNVAVSGSVSVLISKEGHKSHLGSCGEDQGPGVVPGTP